MDEKKPGDAHELTDEQLKPVNGGLMETKYQGKRYRYVGDGKIFYDSDWDKCYLCPNCGGPVHLGAWQRFYCDPCNESWYWESKLIPNLASGLWEEKGTN